MDKQLIYREDALEIVRRTSGDYAAAFDGRRVEISWCGTYVRCGFRDATGLNMPEDGFCSLGR